MTRTSNPVHMGPGFLKHADAMTLAERDARAARRRRNLECAECGVPLTTLDINEMTAVFRCPQCRMITATVKGSTAYRLAKERGSAK